MVVISHRALGQVSHVLLMREGRMEIFGPAADVMARLRQRQKRPRENVVAMQAAAAGTA
ncbi:hypothetical protein [Sphingobium herbicidovorans]|uniref:hypothetical protein n=1 Tax=Sphingobium herbicidovorans TaxID=76947 RepID=UPI0018D42293|nr:hypothetical protein [Sphingobium herbicidovorans]